MISGDLVDVEMVNENCSLTLCIGIRMIDGDVLDFISSGNKIVLLLYSYSLLFGCILLAALCTII